ncbi:MAG: 50S ribosomal protein L25 [Dehalococcoidia bacterium]|nr:MAG: 50S ribosomal protein L25 [Dehalococcoidia bacterium]
MEGLTLSAAKRSILGKKTRFLRRQGITPTHLFGHNISSSALQCETDKLKRIIAQAGRTRLISLEVEDDKQPRTVFIREIQRDAVSDQLLHVDFYQVKKTEKIKVDIPIVLVGEAPAMKEKDRILTHGVTSLSIECLPDKLPPQIEVDLSPLEEIGQAIYIRDLAISPDITVTTDSNQLVVKIAEARVEEVVEEEVAAEAAPEEAEGEAAPEAVEKPEESS